MLLRVPGHLMKYLLAGWVNGNGESSQGYLAGLALLRLKAGKARVQVRVCS